MQARGDPVGDDAGAEPARRRALAPADDPAAEDQRHPVGAAEIEVVADHLVEEDPPVHRGVQCLGQGEFRLQDRQLIAEAGLGVTGGERVRQHRQQPGGERLDLPLAHAVADRLHRSHVIDGGERVVQRGEPDACLGGLALGVLVAVDDQPAGIREIAGELHAHRPELLIHAVEVILIHHARGRHQPRVSSPGHRVTALHGPEYPLLFLRHPGIQHLRGHQPAIISHSPPQVPGSDIVLTLPRGETHQVQSPRGEEMTDVRGERRRHRGHQRRGGKPVAPVPHEERSDPRAVLQPGLVQVQVHAIDRLDLEQHMTSQHIASRTR